MAPLVVIEVALDILRDTPLQAKRVFYLLKPPEISSKQDLHITLWFVSLRYARGGFKVYHSRPLFVPVISPLF